MMNALQRKGWRLEAAQSVQVEAHGQALEFLPAVLEIQDVPPSPIGRAILWTIMLVFASAVAWSSLSHVDIVAVAPGKIIPSGHSKTIQPFETGVITAIHLQDGQVVKQGEVLIELDATQNRADRDRDRRICDQTARMHRVVWREPNLKSGRPSVQGVSRRRHLKAVQGRYPFAGGEGNFRTMPGSCTGNESLRSANRDRGLRSCRFDRSCKIRQRSQRSSAFAASCRLDRKELEISSASR